MPRISYFSVVPLRFLPSPSPLEQTAEGLKSPDRSGSLDKKKFSSLFVALSINWTELLPISTRSLKQLPYDFHCPSVQCVLLKQIYKVCGLYFASKVLLKQHVTIHNQTKEPPTRPVRPIRLAAKRQRELMVIIANEMDGPEQAEWIDEEEIDLESLIIPPEVSTRSIAMPLVSMENHLSTPLEEALDD